MLTEIDIGGVYVAAFAVHLALAAPVFFIVRWLLARSHVLSRLWYLALCELALFAIVLFFTFPLVTQ